MKRNVPLAVLFFVWLAAAGCGGILTKGGSEAACGSGGAGSGEVPADLVAEGTVERVKVGLDSSLVKIRLDRVLKGNAADTIFVRTSSGIGVAAEDDVVFEEGAYYRLRLQRQGDVFTTNICLGTRRVE